MESTVFLEDGAGDDGGRLRLPAGMGFLCLGFLCLGLLALGMLGTRWTHVEVSGAGGLIAAVIVMFAVLLPLPAYWQQRQEFERRDAALMLYWTILFVVLLPYPVLVAARLQMPLQDSLMASVDGYFHVSVPGLMAWAQRHRWLNETLNFSYASTATSRSIGVKLA